MTTTPTPRSFLPLTSAVFQILLSLVDSTRHGYGISKDVAGRTAGDVTLGPGTLYGTLNRLVKSALVHEVESHDLGGDDDTGAPRDDDRGRRRYYALTPLGRQVVALEAARLEQLVSLARAKALIS